MTSRIVSLFVLIFIAQFSFAQSIHVASEVTGDEFKDKVNNMNQIVLENGLTIYLSEDHTQHDILGAVVVRGGSKLDPDNASGTAHYFEHMMFKGSRTLGTNSYESEKPYLDSIKILYDLMSLDRDNEVFRSRILQRIDSFSVLASKYAIPNEFSKIMSELGATGLNAYTTYENIVYHNRFPKESLPQWVELYCDRFDQPVFRLFQSELETVYEEKNRSMDNYFRTIFEEVYKNFYPSSIYGQRTVLGSVEDLKNPSLSAIESYWKANYNANNMALILIGDFNTDEIIGVLKDQFGSWRKGDDSREVVCEEKPFDGRVKVKRKMAPIPLGIIGYRAVAQGDEDELALSVAINMLTNEAQTGLIDTINISQDILEAQVFADMHYDIGGVFVFFVPKPIIQSIDNAEKKVLAQIEKLKKGEFDDLLFRAVVKSMIKQESLSMEESEYRLSKIIDMFMNESDWKDVILYNDKLNKLSKQDVIRVANKYFGENYLAFHSKMGLPKKEKISKPKISPLISGPTDTESEMAIRIRKMESILIEPHFIDFNNDVISSDIRFNMHFYYTKNPYNDIFTMNIRFGIGDIQKPKLQQLAFFLNNTSPASESFSAFSKSLQVDGTSISFNADHEFFTITIEGFESQLQNSLNQLNALISNPRNDKSITKKMVNEDKMEIKMLKKDLGSRMEMLEEYAKFGNQSSFLLRSTKKEIKNITIEEYQSMITELFQTEVFVHFVGNSDEKMIKNVLTTSLPFGNKLKKSNAPFVRDLVNLDHNKLYFLEDKKAIQTHVRIGVPSSTLDNSARLYIAPFNYYFGLGMNSLLFKEAREYRSLAYGAWGYFSVPYRYDKPGYLKVGINTQADKTNEAVELMLNLIGNMPMHEDQINSLKNYMLRSFNSKTPGFRNISYTVQYWMQQGFTEDPRRSEFLKYEYLESNDILRFYNSNVYGKKYFTCLLGDSEQFDLEKLKIDNEYRKLDIKDVLRY